MKSIISEFIEDVKKALIEENEERKNYNEKKQLDLPFIISSLQEGLFNNELVEFINDISINRYSLQYEDINNGYYDYGILNVSLFSQQIINDELHITDIDYTYSIIFCYDPRSWGYCQCKKSDKDYREDKDCCGHGCDWWAPAFRIVKEISIGSYNWNGDQHDYWEYEDSFYKSDKELSDEKERSDRERRIKELETNIKTMARELDELRYIHNS